MEFDKDGRIIPIGEPKDFQNSILFIKDQINAKNPAIAQLKIKIGENIGNYGQIMNEIERWYEAESRSFNDVETKVISSEGRRFVVEARSSWLMYSFLDKMIQDLRMRLDELGFKIIVEGSYAKYD